MARASGHDDSIKWSGQRRVAFVLVASVVLWFALIGLVVAALGLLG